MHHPCIHICLNRRVLTVGETNNFAPCSHLSSKDDSCCGKYVLAVLFDSSFFEVLYYLFGVLSSFL